MRVEIERDFICINVTPNYPYVIERSMMDRMDWLNHLRFKNWFTEEVELEFISAIKAYWPDVYKKMDFSISRQRIVDAMKARNKYLPPEKPGTFKSVAQRVREVCLADRLAKEAFEVGAEMTRAQVLNVPKKTLKDTLKDT